MLIFVRKRDANSSSVQFEPLPNRFEYRRHHDQHFRLNVSCIANVLLYLHNVKVPLSNEFMPNVADYFCRLANRSLRAAGRDS